MTNAFDVAVTTALDELARGPGPVPWLGSLKRAAALRYQAAGAPHTRLEDWKYTNLGGLLRASLHAAGAADGDALTPAAIDGLALAAASRWRVVLVNGVMRPDLCRLDDLPRGLTVRRLTNLPDAAASLSPLFEDSSGGALRALNTALLLDGLIVDVDADASIDEPLHIILIGHDHAGAILRNPRIIVRAGAHCRLRIIEEHVSHGTDGGLTNVVSDIQLARGAELHHHRLQTIATSAAHLGRLDVRVGADATFASDSVVFGGNLTRIDIDVALAARGARCRLNGLFVGAGSQHIDHHTRIDHLVGDTHSEELYRGILDGRSRGVFNGKVIVHAQAQKITARQTSNNLLLSREAEIDTKPELEIYADDVACTHGATVGEIDAAALFYLRSRGVALAEARALLTYAFARQVIEHIPLASLRAWIERRFLGHVTYSELLEALDTL